MIKIKPLIKPNQLNTDSEGTFQLLTDLKGFRSSKKNFQAKAAGNGFEMSRSWRKCWHWTLLWKLGPPPIVGWIWLDPSVWVWIIWSVYCVPGRDEHWSPPHKPKPNQQTNCLSIQDNIIVDFGILNHNVVLPTAQTESAKKAFQFQFESGLRDTFSWRWHYPWKRAIQQWVSQCFATKDHSLSQEKPLTSFARIDIWRQ